MAHVVLGVSASVALHRGLDVASELKKGGHDVTALMTPSATKLIAPLQFQAITGRRVFHDLFQGADDDAYDHLNPARDGDLLICAPATADLIGRLAHGLADDMVTTTAVAFPADKPRLTAPAMNWRMWANPLVQRNVATLCEEGWKIIGPSEGDLACGEQGPGRLAPIDEIVRAIISAL
jgi:phosphopantothenoylcysteine synthetase/decarboxylase